MDRCRASVGRHAYRPAHLADFTDLNAFVRMHAYHAYGTDGRPVVIRHHLEDRESTATATTCTSADLCDVEL